MQPRHPLMMCGHTAEGTDKNGILICVTCYPLPASYVVDSRAHDLTNRRAKCAYHHAEDDSVPSDLNLPFFEFRGEGSADSVNFCKHCGYYKIVHDPTYYRYKALGHEFEPCGPFEYDRYYCGCRGWD